MFGSLDISTSALVAHRQHMTVISQNVANARSPVDPARDPDDFRRRIPIMAPGDPASGSPRGVHMARILYDQAPFRMEFAPDHPFADSQGYVRYPNIDTSYEMINAVEINRVYEANITAAEATKSMIQSSLRLLA